jgi:hypothetical protein
MVSPHRSLRNAWAAWAAKVPQSYGPMVHRPGAGSVGRSHSVRNPVEHLGRRLLGCLCLRLRGVLIATSDENAACRVAVIDWAVEAVDQRRPLIGVRGLALPAAGSEFGNTSGRYYGLRQPR